MGRGRMPRDEAANKDAVGLLVPVEREGLTRATPEFSGRH